MTSVPVEASAVISDDAIVTAAMWLSEQNPPPTPVIPALKQRFGLSALQATKACEQAFQMRMRRRAFA